MTYDVEKIRSNFSSLDSIAFFDGPGGSQVPLIVGNAICDAITRPTSNRGLTTESELNADKTVQEFRLAVADLIDADVKGVIYGRSWTQLTYDFSRILSKTWNVGDEIVVSTLDHDSNVRPWIQVAATMGVVVKWAEIDVNTGELSVSAVVKVLSPKTRLVAITGAGNTLGTRPDIKKIAAEVHKVSALLYVDGVHLTPHAAVSMKDLDADFYGFSFYKLMGPHCAVLAASPILLESLENDKLLPSANIIPERFEFGTLPYEIMAGCVAAVDFISEMAPGDGLSRREKIVNSMNALEEYEHELFQVMEAGIKAIRGVRTYGHAKVRTPTIYFTIDSIENDVIYKHLASKKINAPASNFYALEVSRALGLGDSGAVRAGLAPYSSHEDVQRLLTALRELVQ